MGTGASGSREAYLAGLRKLSRAKSKREFSRLRSEASKLRQAMIGKKHRRRKKKNPDRDNSKQVPLKVRDAIQEALKTKEGREALERFRKFTGVMWPTRVTTIDTPGSGPTRYRAGLGRTPVVYLADGPKGRHKKKIKIKGRWKVATNAKGNRIFIYSGKNSHAPRRNLKFVGHAPQTDYILDSKTERAGSFKAGKHWQHKHDDEGGEWPKAYRDQAGNIVYGPGTYKISKWIRR